MRYVSELNDVHAGADIYVVGTGASIRVFPTSFLEDKITIGLNLAWKLTQVRYGITQRPELNISEFIGEGSRPEIMWITKYGKLTSPEQRRFVEENDDRFLFFESEGQASWVGPNQPSESGRILDWVRRPSGNNLYLWSSISQTAVNLAANMGAKNVILVGCDNCALLDNHHAHDQHTMWKGAEPDARYTQYYEGLVEVRHALRDREVNILSVTPFVSLDAPERDFGVLCAELDQPRSLESFDISVRARFSDHARHYARLARRALAAGRRAPRE